MRALILAAALTVACTTFAGAAEVKKDAAAAPVAKVQAMTDADLDKVVAGNNGYRGGGVGYGNGHGCNCGRGASQNNYHARF
jgi:hypothetical protein